MCQIIASNQTHTTCYKPIVKKQSKHFCNIKSQCHVIYMYPAVKFQIRKIRINQTYLTQKSMWIINWITIHVFSSINQFGFEIFHRHIRWWCAGRRHPKRSILLFDLLRCSDEQGATPKGLDAFIFHRSRYILQKGPSEKRKLQSSPIS